MDKRGNPGLTSGNVMPILRRTKASYSKLSSALSFLMFRSQPFASLNSPLLFPNPGVCSSIHLPLPTRAPSLYVPIPSSASHLFLSLPLHHLTASLLASIPPSPRSAAPNSASAASHRGDSQRQGGLHNWAPGLLVSA